MQLTQVLNTHIFNQMVEYNQADKNLDKAFAALADSTRRSIVHFLAQNEMTVSEIAEPFDMSLAAVSKHLKILENANLISRRIEGRTHYLKLKPDQLTGALDWISVYRNFWNQQLDRLAELEEDS